MNFDEDEIEEEKDKVETEETEGADIEEIEIEDIDIDNEEERKRNIKSWSIFILLCILAFIFIIGFFNTKDIEPETTENFRISAYKDVTGLLQSGYNFTVIDNNDSVRTMNNISCSMAYVLDNSVYKGNTLEIKTNITTVWFNIGKTNNKTYTWYKAE